ncbi:DUF2189 domain-containing protein [Uliginosibacterium sp. H1]|uniref:DUF2189 domain-containing protein n=1 Tax=Uliginosibacterium sp. H1 TaxID=3114757 RepID=UPI002E1A00D6|nr:DUF2189 domain-containing protein [Uliginosibacterium sp. H1]
MENTRESGNPPEPPPHPVSPFPEVRAVPLTRPFVWLARGIVDLRVSLGASLFFGFCFASMGLTITVVFEHAYQYTSALTSGFLLLGPFLSMGLYELSRQRMLGQRPDFLSALTVWRRNAGNLGIFGLVLTIVFLVWARASLVLFALFYTSEMPNLSGFLGQILRAENIKFLAIYCAVGMVFAALVLGISLVSIPLMLDRRQDAITAMLASLLALSRNPGTCLVWAVLIVSLTAVGFLSFHAGLVVVVPVLGHATWHAYRDLVAPPAEDASTA